MDLHRVVLGISLVEKGNLQEKVSWRFWICPYLIFGVRNLGFVPIAREHFKTRPFSVPTMKVLKSSQLKDMAVPPRIPIVSETCLSFEGTVSR